MAECSPWFLLTETSLEVKAWAVVLGRLKTDVLVKLETGEGLAFGEE